MAIVSRLMESELRRQHAIKLMQNAKRLDEDNEYLQHIAKSKTPMFMFRARD